MTLLVRNEEDIIRDNINFHLSQGVDFIIAMDNNSEDKTTQILKEFASRGVLHYIYQPSDNYDQKGWVTSMARLAYNRFGADWVINNDADEFWWPLKGNLKSTFDRIPFSCNLLRAQRKNFVPLDFISGIYYKSMIYRELVSLNYLGNPLPPKVAHRGSGEILVEMGNHNVRGGDNVEIEENLVDIFHFPIRSKPQFVKKIQKGGAAINRNKGISGNSYRTWRILFDDLQTEGNLDTFFANSFYDAEKVKRSLKNGLIVEDKRFCQYMDALYGTPTN